MLLQGLTALHLAVLGGYAEAIEVLLDHGADADTLCHAVGQDDNCRHHAALTLLLCVAI